VNSFPKTVTRERCDCDLNPVPSAPESSTITTRLPSIQEVTLISFSVMPVYCSAVTLCFNMIILHVSKLYL